MPTLSFEDQVRRRVEHSISYETGAVAAMTIADIQQFIAGCYQPSPGQLVQLALRLGVPVPSDVAATALAGRAAKRKAA